MLPEPTPRRRRAGRSVAAGVAAALVAAGAVYGLSDHHRGAAFAVKTGTPLAAPAATDYHAYVASIENEVFEFDSASGSRIDEFGYRDSIGSTVLDSPVGIAATPDGSQVFVADEGKSSVLAIATATNTRKQIELAGNPPPGTTTTPLPANALSGGGFPEDVAVAPDGSYAYVTVTGPPDTGPGGPHLLAVLDTATDTVTGTVDVGDSPRQVIFSPDGTRAYVTANQAIDVVDTAAGRLVASIPDPAPGGPQDLAISPDGSTVYVTNPVPGTLTEISTATNRVTATIRAGDEPYAVAVSPDSRSVYVTDMNSDTVRVIDAATNRPVTNIAVQGLPESLGFTPDGSQLWVGNTLQGTISVIDPTTNTVAGTLTTSRTPQGAIDQAPSGFAFVTAPPATSPSTTAPS